jgi:hypothetical protein
MSAKSRIEKVETDMLDRLLGIDTSGYDERSFTGSQNNGYHSKGYYFTFRYLVPLKLGPNDVLYDIGCGAGRVICIASLMNIRKVYGVDISNLL